MPQESRKHATGEQKTFQRTAKNEESLYRRRSRNISAGDRRICSRRHQKMLPKQQKKFLMAAENISLVQQNVVLIGPVVNRKGFREDVKKHLLFTGGRVNPSPYIIFCYFFVMVQRTQNTLTRGIFLYMKNIFVYSEVTKSKF